MKKVYESPIIQIITFKTDSDIDALLKSGGGYNPIVDQLPGDNAADDIYD